MSNRLVGSFRPGGMRRLHSTLGASALLLVAAACGQQPAQEVGFGGQPPSPPDPPAHPEPNPVHQRSPVPDPEVDRQQLPQGYPNEVWTQDDDQVVVATGQEGGCSEVHAELTDQNSERVTITFVEETPDPPGMCTMDMRYPPLAVSLDEPLGDRTIVLEQRDVQVPR